ncbi:hypothetical protein R6Q57_025268 [Mikania cordata]
MLQKELDEAKKEGFVSKIPIETKGKDEKKKLLAVVGILTGFGRRHNRDAIRKAWMPTGTTLKKLEVEKGIVIRFVIGRSSNHGNNSDSDISNENKRTNDFLILNDHVEALEAQPVKTKLFFIDALQHWDAEFYVKVNDDIYLNIDALGAILSNHVNTPRAYIGCMKSGGVFSNPNDRWYEPEWWKFGDKKAYYRHASGEIFAVSRALAQFISINKSILRAYAHDDVSVGSWFIGLDVKHIDDGKFCCPSWSSGCSSNSSLLMHGSVLANSKPPAAVRAGIPICFPQFGNRGSLEQHGFARNKIWEIDRNPPPLHHNDCDGKAFIDLLLKPSEEDMRVWPNRFEFRLRVLLTSDGTLKLISRVRNIGFKAFSFSIAYHTYFLVSDISEVRVEGLETLDYLDNLHHKQRFTEQGDALTFETEVDRVYISSPHMIGVFDHEKKRTFLIRKEGLPDAVVWNPWEKKAKAITDMADEEYRQTICVDGAAVERPITLKPGEEWTGRLELSALPSL